MADNSPVLYLFPAPLWPGTADTFLTDAHRAVIRDVRVIASENSHRTAAYFSSVHKSWRAASCVFFDLKSREPSEIQEFLEAAKEAGAGLLVSDAGMPCVADPGHLFVRRAHEQGFRTVPLPGPVSLMLALAASGLQGQNFCFRGYPPSQPEALSRHVKKLAQEIMSGVTLIYMEAPQRNRSFFDALIKNLPAEAYLCVASALQSPSAFIVTRRVHAWDKPPLFKEKAPCLFLVSL
ncbi:MAG: SAM-dependent methyltransferase [Flavobacteriales bacterium]|nr:SAM-dependent methyltransferase [Flavobacteriales bacterium]